MQQFVCCIPQTVDKPVYFLRYIKIYGFTFSWEWDFSLRFFRKI